MTAFKVFTGIANGGPLNGQVQTRESTRLNLPGKGGFYAYVAASGPTPGGWRWIATKGTKE